MVKVAYTVGRFQPPTIGHQKLINAVLSAAGPGGKAYVFVSSTQGTGKEKLKNPLTSAQKIPILTHMFPSGVEFVDTQVCKDEGHPCGGALAAFYYLTEQKGIAPEDITLVVGDDHEKNFGAKADIWKRREEKDRFGPGGVSPTEANFLYVKSDKRNPNPEIKDADNMSGTKARQYVKLNRLDDFYAAIGYGPTEEKGAAKSVYDTIKRVVGGSRTKGGVDTSEVMFSADAEFSYAKKTIRRKRRSHKKTRRSKASSKA
jgi:hypothetical protein